MNHTTHPADNNNQPSRGCVQCQGPLEGDGHLRPLDDEGLLVERVCDDCFAKPRKPPARKGLEPVRD